METKCEMKTKRRNENTRGKKGKEEGIES